jgi:nucleoside 2-deoxyribosyltransferase
MRIYLAGRYSRRNELRDYADTLRRHGHTVTSRWLDEDKPLDGALTDQTDEWLAQTAAYDLYYIDSADVLLFFSEDPLVGIPRGGRHVEFGYALGRGKWINVIGPMENVFHYYKGMIKHYDSFESFLAANIQEVTFGV